MDNVDLVILDALLVLLAVLVLGVTVLTNLPAGFVAQVGVAVVILASVMLVRMGLFMMELIV